MNTGETKTILVVEDESSILMLLQKILQREGYNVIPAENGKIGLEKFLNNPVDVIVSDFNMPEMQGDEFIDGLHNHGFNPVFIIATANTDINIAIEMMKRGAFDYILKPFNDKEIIAKIEKAFENVELRHMKAAVEKEQEIRIQKQVSWNAWKEDVASRDSDKHDKALFYNLRTTLSQGAGFGGLISLIYFIAEQVQQENGKYYIDADLMDLITTNASIGKQVLDTFNEIDLILNNEIKTELLTVGELYDILMNVVSDLSAFAKLNAQTVHVSTVSAGMQQAKVAGHKEYLARVFKELLLNAMKFSLSNTSIIVIFSSKAGELGLSFISKPIPLSDGIIGIPNEYERMVFEPFFRLVKTVDERFNTLDFGLGLTFADKVIRSFHGKLTASNIIYHDIFIDPAKKQEKDERVSFVVSLPLQAPADS